MEVRVELEFVMPESKVTRLIPGTRDPEKQPHFVHSGGEIFVPPSVGSRQPRIYLRTVFGKKYRAGA